MTHVDLARDTIFVTLAGSQAHGTARSGSDVDLRGVCVAPLATRVSLFDTFEQYEGALDGSLWDAIRPRLEAHETAALGLAVKTEAVIYDVAKFLGLCASSNPNALEILFADPRDWVFDTPAWRRIHAERHRFLSTRVQATYLGYAMAQLRKIESHRAWLLHPPDHEPTRAEFGLREGGELGRDDRARIEQSVAERIRAYRIDTIEMPKALRIELEERLRAFYCDAVAVTDAEVEDRLRDTASRALALPSAVVESLESERKYRAARKRWDAYRTWKKERNPARAALEARHGYDTKHGMHLLRLMKTGLELLETGELRVRRPDAEWLLAVRDGSLSYEALLDVARDLEQRMEAALRRSSLPSEIDYRFVDALALEAIRDAGTPPTTRSS